MDYSVAITEEENHILKKHLIRNDKQEDLCFGLYHLSTGSKRTTALITEILIPNEGDRNVHGNVSFNVQYFDRISSIALKKGCGICFLHSHPANGWQGMSRDDIIAEEMLSPRVKSITKLPLVGLTVGTDLIWSARFWIKEAPKKYKRYDCKTVRVIGKGLQVSYYDRIIPPPFFGDEYTRTVSAWGDRKQADLSRLKVGIVGLGSVGSVIAEALFKTGIQHLTLIDFDTVENKNLDRLQGLGSDSIGKAKIFEIKNRLKKIQLGDGVTIDALPYSIIEKEGFKSALDCDILFSCVDRPWPRFILNCIAYAHLIPVIDGGIDTNPNKKFTNLDQARWKAHIVGSGRRCLCCLDQFSPEDVALEQSGLLEDTTYIKNLPKEHFVKRGENVFIFSLSLAAMEMQQFLSLNLQPRGQFYGPKEFDFNSGNIDSDFQFDCNKNCQYAKMESLGDQATDSLIRRHVIAEVQRQKYSTTVKFSLKSEILLSIKKFLKSVRLTFN